MCFKSVVCVLFLGQDDLKTVVASQKKQLQDAQEQQGKVEGKMASAMNTLRQFQEEKGSLEAKLGQKNAALQIQVTLLITDSIIFIYKLSINATNR